MNSFWDRLGISASILCVVHCLLTPMLVVFLPLVGATLARGWFHAAIIATVVPVAIFALWKGYRVHRQTHILWMGAFGFVAIALAAVFGAEHNAIETGFMVAGGLVLSAAHYLNMRTTRNCRH